MILGYGLCRPGIDCAFSEMPIGAFAGHFLGFFVANLLLFFLATLRSVGEEPDPWRLAPAVGIRRVRHYGSLTRSACRRRRRQSRKLFIFVHILDCFKGRSRPLN
jgi:hypothetical protein